MASAQTRTYSVQSGDTISGIAEKFDLRTADLVRANSLSNSHKLKLGQRLVIPSAARPTISPLAPGQYAIRAGDNDTTLAKRFGVTSHQLRAMNLGVDWRRLQLGQRVRVPSRATAAVAKPTVRVASATAVRPIPRKPVATRRYTVVAGDNDWVIAKKLGTTPKKLRLANMQVSWRDLRPGHTLAIPGRPVTASRVAAGPIAASRVVAKAPTKKPTPARVAVKKSNVATIRSRYARVAGDRVSVRSAPGLGARKLSLVGAGARGTVLTQGNGWAKMQFPGGTVGWIRADFLAPVSAPARVAAKPKPKSVSKPVTRVAVKATVQRTSARRSASARPVAATKVVMKKPAKRTVTTRPKPVARKTRPSVTPRVASYTRDVDASGNPVVSRAETWKGTRYRYGAMSRSATDCSGFTSQVYRSVGVKLPRTSGQQANVGQKVDRSSMKPGDLVFFRTVRGRRVGHVGIYVGNGKFIHASSKKGVRVDSLGSGYYNNRFVGARRVSNSLSGTPKPKAKPVAKAKSAPTEAPVAAPAPTPVADPAPNPPSGGEN